jgi:uridine kinase
VREIVENDGTIHYEAGIKGNERLGPDGRARDELVDGVPIPKELFEYYTNGADLPFDPKLRAKFNANVVIDFTEDGVSVETEDPIARDAFFDRMGGKHQFMEVTGDRSAKSRWRAEKRYRITHAGRESFPAVPEFDTNAAVAEILQARMAAVQPLVVAVGGRSGSGKSTVIKTMRAKLAELGLTSDVVSTDDYHRGKTWLEGQNGGEHWERWDDEIVYNLRALTEDLASYKEGAVIPRLHMDFVTQEPKVNGTVRPVDVLLVEGIYANSLEVSAFSDIEFELPTPFATCVWRRMLRDAKERPEFGDYTKSLLYILTQAEPAYRAQKAKRAVAEQKRSS